jgi:phosphoglycolate phosphatase
MKMKVKNIKTIIFDFDGTIADALPIVIDSANILSKEYGHRRITNDDRLRDMELSEFIRKELKISVFQLAFYYSKIKKLMNDNIDKVYLIKGLRPVISKLSKKYKIGVISSNSDENIRHVLDKYRIKADFVFHSSAMFGKSSTMVKAMKKHSLKKGSAIYVGDETRDIIACKKSKIQIIAVAWGFNSRKILSKHRPDYLIDKPKQLLKIL